MKSYFAYVGKKAVKGGFSDCLVRGAQMVEEDEGAIVKLCCARGGEKNARILAELSRDGLRFCRSGRMVKLRTLERCCE